MWSNFQNPEKHHMNKKYYLINIAVNEPVDSSELKLNSFSDVRFTSVWFSPAEQKTQNIREQSLK